MKAIRCSFLLPTSRDIVSLPAGARGVVRIQTRDFAAHAGVALRFTANTLTSEDCTTSSVSFPHFCGFLKQRADDGTEPVYTTSQVADLAGTVAVATGTCTAPRD